MNDFTKEELETILDAIHCAENDVCNRSCEPWDAELSSKIQSMIDNYCVHYWVTDPRLHFMSNPAKIKCACTKCPATRYINIININEPEYCAHSGAKLEKQNG